MRHATDGVLRRLDDEPLAVPDRVIDHVAECGRCRARRAEIARDTEIAAGLLSGPRLAPDTGAAWARLTGELNDRSRDGAGRWLSVPVPRRRDRPPRVSWRSGLVAGAVGIVVAGTAAAASLTSVFAPTHVAPVSVNASDLRALAGLMGLGGGHALGGFSSPEGSSRFRFGTVTWSSLPAHSVTSRAAAGVQAGFPVSLPAHLPAGVGSHMQFTVAPRVSARVTFNSSATGLGGSSVTLDAGPAVLAQYPSASQTGMPALAVATMRRPTASSTGATTSQIEAFLLRQPGIPPELAEEVRLLGDLRTTLPVPVPPGVSVRSVVIAGWPGLLLADASNAAAAAVWEDGRGILHVVAGILDSSDVLNVADQLG